MTNLDRLIRKSNYALVTARICVSLKEPNQIVSEVNEKYKTGEDTYSFIQSRFLKDDNVYNWHLSPLGLVWIESKENKNLFKAQGLYSLRHLYESFIEKFNKKSNFIRAAIKIFYTNKYMIEIPPFEDFDIEENFIYSIKDRNIKPQKLYVSEDVDGVGFYIIWEGCSRVATHQLVRHQSFDYQQQSQRYLNYDRKIGDFTGFYIPESVFESIDCLECYIEEMEEIFRKYRMLINEGIKPEEARYILPSSFTSRIVFFAPKERMYGRDGIKEFIEKRKEKGQKEIREFAKTLEKILFR